MKASRVVLGVTLLLAIGGVAWAVSDRMQSIAEIDKSSKEISSQLEAGEEQFAKYEGGAIAFMLSARNEMLRLSLAMLEQKRLSWIHRINLTYTIDGKAFAPEKPEVIAVLEDELRKTNERITAAEMKSSMYEGGLIKVMAQMEKATAEQTYAMIQMRLVAAKYGVPFFGKEPPPPPSAGTVEPDEEVF